MGSLWGNSTVYQENQAGLLLTSVMRLNQMGEAVGKDKASWHEGRVCLNKEVNLEIQRQNNAG